jgi:hypothetical protein
VALSSFPGLTATLRGLIEGALQRTDDITGTIITRYGTTAELAAITPQPGELVINTDLNALVRGDGSTPAGISLLANLNGQQCVFVNSNAGTTTLNADALRTAYAAAAALTPYGNALSATNRAKVLVMPGRYNIDGGASDMTFATEFVDVVALGLSPEDTVIEVGTSHHVIQSANDCHLSNFTIYNTANAGGFVMSTSAGHTATLHDNLRFVNSSTATVRVMSFSTWTNFSGTYRDCHSTHPGMYGQLPNGTTCNAIFEGCQAPLGSLGSSVSNTEFVEFSGRHSRCRMWATSSAISAAMVCVNGAVIEYGYYNGVGGSTAMRVFKVTGATTPGPFFQFNTIIAAGTTPYSIDRKSSETNGVLVAMYNRMPVLGITSNLTNAGGLTAAQAFNIEHASVTG